MRTRLMHRILLVCATLTVVHGYAPTARLHAVARPRLAVSPALRPAPVMAAPNASTVIGAAAVGGGVRTSGSGDEDEFVAAARHLKAYAKKVLEQLPSVSQPDDPSLPPKCAIDIIMQNLKMFQNQPTSLGCPAVSSQVES